MRPSPLLVDFPLSGDDSEHWHRREVPVHRTFIEFGCPRRALTRRRSLGSRTTPASMASSIRVTLGLDVEEEGHHTPSTPPPRRPEPLSGDEAAAPAGSLPAVCYRFSPTSAKAAGYRAGRHLAAPPRLSSRSESLILEEEQKLGLRLQPMVRAEEATALAVDAEFASSRSTDAGDSSEEEDEGLCPAYSANAELPSVGSAAHSEGTCKRCCFFPKGRCNNGFGCPFCHFAHEKRKPKNKKKLKKRSRKLGRFSDASAFAMQMALGAPHAFALGLCAVDTGEGLLQVGADYAGQFAEGHYYLAMMPPLAPYCVY